MLETILTHPGGAHKDEVLAACVLIAKNPGAPVLRREPTPEELLDASVAVLDIGGVHDPDTLCFDHHHFPREHPPTCCLSLVLEHLGLYKDALQFCDWLETAEWFDSRGPVATAQWLGVPRAAVSRLNSPIDMTLLSRFAKALELGPGDAIYEYMRLVGEDLLQFLRDARTRLDFVAAHAERWKIRRGEAPERLAVFLPRTDPLAEEPSRSVAAYVRAEALEADTAAIIYPDRRGPGYGLARYEDFMGLDFSRVEAESDVIFAHKRGFMCKTSATEPERLKALLDQAWVD